MRSLAFSTCLVVVIGLVSAAPATVIDLNTGERVIGTIIDQNEEVYIIDHVTFGQLVIPKSQVSSVTEPPAAQSLPAPQIADEPAPTPPPTDQSAPPAEPKPRVPLIPQGD